MSYMVLSVCSSIELCYSSVGSVSSAVPQGSPLLSASWFTEFAPINVAECVSVVEHVAEHVAGHVSAAEHVAGHVSAAAGCL